MKEKRAEFTLSRLHPVGAAAAGAPPASPSAMGGRPAQPIRQVSANRPPAPVQDDAATWNRAPLVPETDDIPF